jgi:hypothetical protein
MKIMDGSDGQSSNFKPSDFADDDHFDLGHTFGPSVPPGYPRGFRDEPDMGFEGWWRRRDDKDRRPFWKRLFGFHGDTVGGPPPPPPGYGGGYQGGYQPQGGGVQTGASIKEIKRLESTLRQARRGDPVSLSKLQREFDRFRSTLKSEFPTGGPNGPVG